jgi:predicted  nucleic acid-binding Zn-ribbon protein
MSDDNYNSILLEEIRDQNKAVLEAVGSLQRQVKLLPTRDEFNEVKTDIKAIKATVKDTNQQVQNHEQRVTKLEAKAA